MSPLRDRLDVLRRDLRMVANDLVGRRGPTFAVRAPLARHAHIIASGNQLLSPRPTKIVSITRETTDAVTIELDEAASFHPGQFLTLLVTIDGVEHRRAYSISTAPHDGRVAVTVKRMGLVSSYLVERARPGDRLQVLGPSGSFGLKPDAARKRTVVLIGGGSGITPLFSIARAVLFHEPESRVALLFGNRSLEDAIFRDALPNDARFTVRHVLETPPSEWSGGVGRLDAATCARELSALEVEDAEFYLCGPEPMMNAAREALLSRGVDPAHIHEEKFTSPTQRKSRLPMAPQPIRVGQKTAIASPGQTILEAGLAAKIALPYSCTMGGCGACLVKVVEGDVEMEEPSCLTREEREGGYVLACVARAQSPVTIEVPS